MANDFIKYAAIGVGGYFLLEYFGIVPSLFGSAVPVVSGGSGQPVGTGGVVSTTPQGADASANTSTTIANMKKLLSAANIDINNYMANTDNWNVTYAAARGIPGPAPEDLFVGVDRNKKYTFAEYWAAMTGKGFSGMGMIAHHVNPYENPMGGNFRFADNIRPSGMEMYVKRF